MDNSDKFNGEFNASIQSQSIRNIERSKEEQYSTELNDEHNRQWKAPLYSELDIHNVQDRIFTTLIDVTSDLVNPKGRSWFDAFWINDRPFYLGLMLLLIAFMLKSVYITLYAMS